MASKNRVTEADLKATEAMLASSFNNLKTSVTRIPSDVVSPVTNTVKKHPYATIAAAAGAGLVAYLLIRAATPRVVVREVSAQPGEKVKGSKSRSRNLLSEIITLATPYIMAYAKQEITRMLSNPQPGQREERVADVPRQS